MPTVSPHDHDSAPSPGPGTTPSEDFEEDFEQEVCALVADLAPRRFAVVQLHAPGTEEADGRIAAWGMAYDDGQAHVVGVDGGALLAVRSPERATRWFARRPGITTRLVWLDPPGAAALDRATAA